MTTNVYVNTGSDAGCCLWQMVKGIIALIVAILAAAACCGTYYGPIALGLF